MGCCSCLKIQVVDGAQNVPSAVLQNGKLFVDVDSEAILEFSKARTELTEVGNIRDEASLPISIPQTDRNNAIAGFVRNHNLIDNLYAPLKVLVQEGMTAHSLNYLQFTGSDDEAGRYNAELIRGEGHWLYEAEKYALYNTPFETFELTKANLIQNWQSEAAYAPGSGLGYYWPLVHYGGWAAERSVVIEDFRPWFHVFAILEKAFCDIGWKFESPFFQSGYGLRIICYLLSENFLEQPELLDLAKFRASLSEAFITNSGLETVIFDTEDYDTGGNFDLTSGSFARAGVFDFKCNLAYPYTAGPISTVRIIKESQFGVITVLAEANGAVGPNGTTASVRVEAKNVILIGGDRVYVQFQTEIPTGLFGYFENKPLKTFFERGSIVAPAELIDQTLTLLDFLKACVHLCAGRIQTDWVNRTVTLYSPYDTIVYGEDVEGFFKEGDGAFVNLSELVISNSEAVSLNRAEKPRYLVLQFKDSGDPKAKEANAGRPEEIFSKTIDRGTLYKPGKEYSKNSLFEPTVNDFLVKFPVVGVAPAISNSEVDLPHCYDNDKGEISFKIGYRILWAAGYKQQRVAETGGNRFWVFENLPESLVPYCFQSPNAPISPAVEIPEERLIYGDEEEKDLFSFCYRKHVLQGLYSVSVSLKALLSADFYKKLSFRDIYKIYYDGRTFTSRLLEVSGRKSCSGEPATIIVQPISRVTDECPDGRGLEGRPDFCPNYPEMDININVTGNTISAVAQNAGVNDPILTDEWEYSTDEGETWQAYTPGTGISAPVVIFRRAVTFDSDSGQCGKVISRRAVFETACDNAAGIELSYEESTNAIIATGTDDFNSPVDLDTWQVEVDGGAAQAYTEGEGITGFMAVKFTRTVSFTNNCEDIVVEQEYEVQGDQCNNAPELFLSEVSDCVYVPEVRGTTSSTICMTVFEVSSDGGATWFPWDGYPVTGTPGKKIRATFQFCDTCPPIYIEQECPF